MFCPQCKMEYVEGITRCPDCEVDLVRELPAESGPEYVDYEMILATYNQTDIALIKDVLESAGITYYFTGELFTYVEPLASTAKLMVRRDQAEQARELLKDLDLAYTAAGGPDGSSLEE
jgi:hypothetical protein